MRGDTDGRSLVSAPTPRSWFVVTRLPFVAICAQRRFPRNGHTTVQRWLPYCHDPFDFEMLGRLSELSRPPRITPLLRSWPLGDTSQYLIELARFCPGMPSFQMTQ